MKMWLSVTCLLLGVSAAQALVPRANVCGGTSVNTQNNDMIVSHKGFEANHTYGINSNCVWKIEAPQGQYVGLFQQSFHVEYDPTCSYDYLELFDGDSTSSPSLGKFCGHNFNPISSTGRFFTLQFVTDEDTQLSGFSLFYNFTNTIIQNTCNASTEFQCVNGKCIDLMNRCDNSDDCGENSDEQNCQAYTNGGVCPGHDFKCANGDCVSREWLCDGEDDCKDNSDEIPSNCDAGNNHNAAVCGAADLTGTAGTITSPKYPHHYPNDASCIYSIHAPRGTQELVFKFDHSFSLEADAACVYDFVRVYSEGSIHGPFCGNVAPDQFIIPGNHAYVQFDSDDSSNDSGFSISWRAHLLVEDL